VPVEHQVYAVRFAHFAGRRRAENFQGGDPHDAPMPFDYFVFAIRGASIGDVVVDTGFDAPTAAARGRRHLRCPGEGLRLIGVDPATTPHVVLSHLHYDHCGNQDLFPAATFHLQAAEMAFATGPCMQYGGLRLGYDPDDLHATLKRLFDGRLVYHDGDEELAEGITLHRIGGHTDGQMAVRVATAKGWLVLASDAVHFLENYTSRRPFPWVYHVGATLAGFEKLKRLASSDDLVVPGHDPGTMTRFPPVPGAEGVAVRLA
jgi:glyoxylase-like metal-dependent hydrolase (beta-lactamase superfamily II)